MQAEYNLEYVYADNRELFQKAGGKNYYIEKKPNVEVVENGIIVPAPLRDKLDYPSGFASRIGGVIDRNGNYVAASKRRLLRYEMDHVDLDQIESDVSLRKETVCYLGPIAGYWGHILTEISCCLWYAVDNPDLRWAYYDYTDPEVTLIRKPLLEFLELLGIKENQLVPITKPTRFSKVIVPEVSAVFGEYYTKEFKLTFDFIRNQVCDEHLTSKKIYLTKTEFQSEKGNQIGEVGIKKIFEGNGFFCVSPEKLSVKEQVTLMANAEAVIAPEGTLPHNILFCQDGVSATIINRKAGVNDYQMQINQLRNAKVTYLDCYYMLLPVYHGPYIFSVNENFERYAANHNIVVDIREHRHIEEYLKIFWYILRYLQLYNLSDGGGQLRKAWDLNSVNNFLMSRKEMEFLNTKEADEFSNVIQEFIRKMVE